MSWPTIRQTPNCIRKLLRHATHTSSIKHVIKIWKIELFSNDPAWNKINWASSETWSVLLWLLMLVKDRISYTSFGEVSRVGHKSITWVSDRLLNKWTGQRTANTLIKIIKTKTIARAHRQCWILLKDQVVLAAQDHCSQLPCIVYRTAQKT